MARFHDGERTKGEKVQMQWSRKGEGEKSFNLFNPVGGIEQSSGE